MMNRPKMTFEVVVELPKGAGNGDLLDYVTDAVKGWHGGLTQDDPLSRVNPQKVKVKILKDIE